MADSTKATVTIFHEPDSHTAQYVIRDPNSKSAAVLDTVLNYDHNTGVTSTAEVDKLIEYVQAEGLEVEYILETHVHADHLTAAPYVKSKLGGKIGIGHRVSEVRDVLAPVFSATPDEFAPVAAEAFDVLFKEGDSFSVGGLTFEVLETPGHTPACVTYHIPGDSVFVGDTVFMPDQGTARCDFPGGSAETLWSSVQKILSLPAETRLFTCHDYAPGGREYAWETTVGSELEANIHVGGDASEASFVERRTTRDATLSLPRLIIPAVQVNIKGGTIDVEANGIAYIRVPLNQTDKFKPPVAAAAAE